MSDHHDGVRNGCRIARHEGFIPRVAGPLVILTLAACLDANVSGPSVVAQSFHYPAFLAIEAGTSYALPRQFDTAVSRVVQPSGIALVNVVSGLSIMALQRGFAQWDPGLQGYHGVKIAVLAGRRSEPILVAHHGAEAIAPENTLAAVKAACDLGIPGIEVDVRFTADSVPVLIHDRDVQRTSNGSGYVDQMTLAELRRLDFGSWYSARYAGERIPTLSEFLSFASACGFDLIQLDVKAFVPMTVDTGWVRIASEVAVVGLSTRVELGAFDLGYLLRARAVAPGAKTLLFVGVVSPAVAASVVANGISAVGADFGDYGSSGDVLSRLDSAGVQIGVWAPPGVVDLNALSPLPRFVTTDWDWVFVN